ncbi:MAG: ATPase, T2SS/T4P/T4SS family, partial [Pseudomonadota bacterium]
LAIQASLTGHFVLATLHTNDAPSAIPRLIDIGVEPYLVTVLAAGVRFTGCTVHFVSAEMDSGPIITQASVPVHQDDTEESLAARVLRAEHLLYPMAVRMIAEDRVRIEGDRVVVKAGAAPLVSLFNPAH